MEQGERTGNGSETEEQRKRVQQMARQASARVEHARVVLDDFNDRAIAFVRERPGTCLLAAVAAGYLIGKLASRK